MQWSAERQMVCAQVYQYSNRGLPANDEGGGCKMLPLALEHRINLHGTTRFVHEKTQFSRDSWFRDSLLVALRAAVQSIPERGGHSSVRAAVVRNGAGSVLLGSRGGGGGDGVVGLGGRRQLKADHGALEPIDLVLQARNRGLGDLGRSKL